VETRGRDGCFHPDDGRAGRDQAERKTADRGYDVDWFRDALEEKGIKRSILCRKSRNEPIKYDKRRYRGRNRIESVTAEILLDFIDII